MDVGQVAGPVAEDVGHVLPRHKVACERVEEALLGVVDLGDAKNVVDVADDGDTLRRDEVGSAVAERSTLNVCAEALNLGSLVTGSQTVQLDGHKGIEVTKGSGVVRQVDVLSTTTGSLSSSTAGLATCTLALRRLKVDGRDVDIVLLKHEDRCSQIPRILLLFLRQVLNVGANEEDVGQVVQLLLGGVGLLVHVSVESDIPAFRGPVRVGVDVQNLSRQGGDLVVVDSERARDLVTSREVLEEVGDARCDVGWDV